MPRFGNRSERHEANQLLSQFDISRPEDVRRWVRKHNASPDKERVVEAAMLRFPDHLVELQKLAGMN